MPLRTPRAYGALGTKCTVVTISLYSLIFFVKLIISKRHIPVEANYHSGLTNITIQKNKLDLKCSGLVI